MVKFPEDYAIGMELLIRYLYGFTIDESYGTEDCRTNRDAPYWGHDLEYYIYILARKYQLPDLASKTVSYLRCAMQTSNDSGIVLEEGRPGWFFDVARSIYNSEEDVPELRKAVLAGFQENVEQMTDRDNVEAVKQGLSMCPGLATDLLLHGGLDGSGAKSNAVEDEDDS